MLCLKNFFFICLDDQVWPNFKITNSLFIVGSAEHVFEEEEIGLLRFLFYFVEILYFRMVDEYTFFVIENFLT